MGKALPCTGAEATLDAAIAVISTIKATNELEAFMATQAVIAGFSRLGRNEGA